MNPFTLQTILTSCTGTIATTSCVENSVPDRSWQYTVTPKMATNWVGAESAKSTAVAVEVTAPTNTVTLNNVTGGAYKSSNNIFYRGAAVGSFTLTNAVADAGSGPASSQSATMTGTSTGWTHTPSTVTTPAGGPYVSNTFSWGAATTTTTPGEVITGRDVANNTATTTLTTTLDNTAPSAGTITPDNGYTAGRSVNVAFTTGTDGGSGIATRQLQRAVATLTAGTCGSYSSYTNLDLPGQTSPYTDTNVAGGNCYMYKYSVTDNVGNEHLATSANVAKLDYATAVNNTTGALSQWRLGETTTSNDTFTDTSGTALTSHTPNIGSTWTHHAGTTTRVISDANRTRMTGTGYSTDYAASPSSANYSTSADLYAKSFDTNDSIGVITRLNTSDTSFYMARWETDNTWNIVKWSGGAASWLWTSSVQPDLTLNQAYRIRLDVSGGATTTLKFYLDGVLQTSVDDTTSPFTAAGKAGIMDSEPGSSLTKTNTTGIHIDNFAVTPQATDSKGTNHGDYFNEPTLAATGAISPDPNTAAQFDGTDDYVDVARQISDDLSIELWFKSTQNAGTSCTQWYHGMGLVDATVSGNNYDFGVSLCQGKVIAGTGNADTSIVSASGMNDGNWHHVVFTRVKVTDALALYIDGASVGTATGGTASLTSPPSMNFGRMHDGTGYFAGTLDEITVYNTALSATTVTNHYQLGTAPAAPVITPTGSTLAYTENGTPLLDSAITATDANTTTLASATVTMTTAYVNGQDTLAFTNQNGITGTWTAGTGVLALTGVATLANYQTALRSITMATTIVVGLATCSKDGSATTTATFDNVTVS